MFVCCHCGGNSWFSKQVFSGYDHSIEHVHVYVFVAHVQCSCMMSTFIILSVIDQLDIISHIDMQQCIGIQ